MKRTRRDYWLALDDDAHLERIGRMRLTRMRIVFGTVSLLAVSTLLGSLLIIATPLKDLLPGYLRDNQRAAGEETLMRLDSLRMVYERNEAYISSVRELLDTGRPSSADSLSETMRISQLPYDSLLSTSRRESDFVKQMREREKYNVGILAPLAAEGLMFHPINDEGIVSRESRKSPKARILLPSGASVGSIADGTVINISARGAVMSLIIQHPKGFVSRYSGLRSVYVAEGDVIYGGQAIGSTGRPSGSTGPGLDLELWHNGSSLVPEEYISTTVRGNAPEATPGLDNSGL